MRLVTHPVEPGAYALTTGPDGGLWFTLAGTDRIGRHDPDTGAVEYHRVAEGSQPSLITTGPDGALWFTQYGAGCLGRITVHGRLDRHAEDAAGPYGLTVGPDRALWFTEATGNRIARLAADGTVTRFPVPVAAAFPSAITTGPDGALWFTLNAVGAIGRLTVDGATDLIRPPTAGGAPVGIAADNRALWYVDIGQNLVGRIDPVAAAAGHDTAVTEYRLPDPAAKPHAIATDGTGGAWFTEWGGNRIGHLDGSGTLDTIDLPQPGSEPHGITVGPDGAAWSALEVGALVRVER